MPRRPRTSSQDLLDEMQIKCIGLILAEWAMLEAIVSVTIWDFSGWTMYAVQCHC